MKQLLLVCFLASALVVFGKNEVTEAQATEVEVEVELASRLSAVLEMTASQALQSTLETSDAISKALYVSRRSGTKSAKCARAIAKASKLASENAVLRSRLEQTLKRAEQLSQKSPKVNDQGWADMVHQSRALLKRSTRITELLARQLALQKIDGKEWTSIWDYLKGIKDGKPFSDRAKEIDLEVQQLMKPFDERREAEANLASTPKANKNVQAIGMAFKAVDSANSNDFTRKLGNPTFQWLISRPASDEYTIEPRPPKIRTVYGNPMVPPYQEGSSVTWSELQKIADDADPSLSPVYGLNRKAHKHVKAKWIKKFPKRTKKAPKPIITTAQAVEYNPKPSDEPNPNLTLKPTILTPQPLTVATNHVMFKKTPSGPSYPTPGFKPAAVKMVDFDPSKDNKHLTTTLRDDIAPEYK